MNLTQWVVLDNNQGYAVMGPTVGELPPGMYDFQATPEGLVWAPVETRTDDLVLLPDTASQLVVSEVEQFWELQPTFAAHHLPFKRGILLYGPPGSGKTCTLRLIAEDLVARGGYVLIFRGVNSFLAGYRQLRQIQPESPVVVFMEDVDAILEMAGAEASHILNVLDGVENMDRVVFVATTNHPQRLEARVFNRPSRFDRRVKIPHPGEASRRVYLDSIALPGDQADLDRMAKDTDGLSLAHVKELFLSTTLLKRDYKDVLRELRAMKERPTEYDDEEEFRTGGPYA